MMTVLVNTCLNLLVAGAFLLKSDKKLHRLEILAYWLAGALLAENYSALNVMNFKTFTVSSHYGLESMHVLNRFVLKPAIFLWFLNGYAGLSSFPRKLAFMSAFAGILLGSEWLDDWLGLFHHHHWRLWWSAAVWLAAVLIIAGFMRFFRRILMKEVGLS